MKIGYTGTQEGMTKLQKYKLQWFLHSLFYGGTNNEYHHGDCIGGDEESHNIVLEIKELYGIWIVSHPCTIKYKRAYTIADEEREIKEPLDRNLDIVLEDDILIAAPKEVEEVMRSGTWATIRRARKNNKPIIRLLP